MHEIFVRMAVPRALADQFIGFEETINGGSSALPERTRDKRASACTFPETSAVNGHPLKESKLPGAYKPLDTHQVCRERKVLSCFLFSDCSNAARPSMVVAASLHDILRERGAS